AALLGLRVEVVAQEEETRDAGRGHAAVGLRLAARAAVAPSAVGPVLAVAPVAPRAVEHRGRDRDPRLLRRDQAQQRELGVGVVAVDGALPLLDVDRL